MMMSDILSIQINITLEWMPEERNVDRNHVPGSGNGLVPSGNKPLHEPVLSNISEAIWCP